MKHASDWLFDTLHYRFRDPDLLTAALTHRSAGGPHNERLEFLGDAILNFAIAAALYYQLPHAPEGDLSRLRASLVKGETLAELAAEISLGEHLRLGSGEFKSGGFRRQSILANALEALMGALYLDGGYGVARDSVAQLFAERMRMLPRPAELKDAKTRLQEYLQGKGLALPAYTIAAEQGEAHDRTFTVACEIESLALRSSGVGKSRRQAEQMAAQRILEQLADA